MQNDVFLNVCRLVDPSYAKDERESIADGHIHHLVAVFFRRLRAFDSRLRPAESLEGILWYVGNPGSTIELTRCAKKLGTLIYSDFGIAHSMLYVAIFN